MSLSYRGDPDRAVQGGGDDAQELLKAFPNSHGSVQMAKSSDSIITEALGNQLNFKMTILSVVSELEHTVPNR